MALLSAFLVALSLSMDNLAVTVAAGCATHRRISLREELAASFSFALAHLTMFAMGWGLGRWIGHFVDAFDHWLAFGILALIGLRMIKESWARHQDAKLPSSLSGRVLLWLAFATSIDAWMVGMGLSFSQVSFWLTVGMMTGCVFVSSWAGFYFGAWLGQKFGQRMEAVGGIVLIGLGVKLLLEGLGIL